MEIKTYRVAIGAILPSHVMYDYGKYDKQDYEARFLFWPWYGQPVLTVL